MTAAEATIPAMPTRRGLIVLAAILPMVLDILDRTIVNIALPDMMGGLGATSNQITWVLTMYLVASAVIIPLTGYLVDRFGQRRLMIASIIGFTVASALCGFSTSLNEMVFWRIVQGASGASLMPLSQGILLTNFPREERGKAMAYWAMGVTLAPVLGPTLGGYLTEWGDWRWVFFVNVPCGLIALFLALHAVPQTTPKAVRTDWTGLILMAAGIIALQLVIDRGNQAGWFQSTWIVALSTLAVIALFVFVWRGWNKPDNIVKLRLLTDRNFATSIFVLFTAEFGLYALVASQPLMLENLFGYPSETTGLLVAPMAVSAAVVVTILGRQMNRIDGRIAIIVGLLFGVAGTYLMTNYNLQMDPFWIIVPGILTGICMALVFLPLMTLAYATLPDSEAHAGAGIFGLMRLLGASIGISAMGTLLSRETQTNWNVLGGHINPTNPALYEWLDAKGLALGDPLTALRLANILEDQAAMLAFVDIYWAVGASFLIILPFVFLIRRDQAIAMQKARSARSNG